MIDCQTRFENWAMIEPFEIAREVITDLPVLLVQLHDGHGHMGQAEAAGVDYDGKRPRAWPLKLPRFRRGFMTRCKVRS